MCEKKTTETKTVTQNEYKKRTITKSVTVNRSWTYYILSLVESIILIVPIVLVVIFFFMNIDKEKCVCNCDNIQPINSEIIMMKVEQPIKVESDTLKILILNQSNVQQDTSPIK